MEHPKKSQFPAHFQNDQKHALSARRSQIEATISEKLSLSAIIKAVNQR
jgi:hypothetical protein